MNCPKCECEKTFVHATRKRQPSDGPHQVIRLRMCARCRYTFRTVEEFDPGDFPWWKGRKSF